MALLFGRHVPDPVIWGWDRILHPETRQPHIMPLADIGIHAFDTECACRPLVDDHGIVIHGAFDGREAYELGLRKRH